MYQAYIMPRVIFVIVFLFFYNLFYLKKYFTCQANIMPHVKVCFLYSIWS